MTRPVRIALAVAVLCGGVAGPAGPASAGCPIDVTGDPVIAHRIVDELALFVDDASPCLSLRAAGSAGNGGLTVELHDELGGTALRTFDSPAGAAAFLVSWSRRPLPG